MSDEMLSLDATALERGLLGALLLQNEQARHSANFFCKPEDFTNPRLGKIFAVIQKLISEKAPIDPATVSAHVLASGFETDRAQLMVELLQMQSDGALPSHVDYYARGIARNGRLDRLVKKVMIAAQARSRSLDEMTRMLGQAVRDAEMPELKTPQPIGEIMLERYNALERESILVREGKDIEGRTFTGIDRIDRQGGKRAGELWVYGARPSHGKTAVSYQECEFAARQCAPGEVVLVIQLEMSPAELAERSFARAGDVPAADLRAGKIPDDAWAPLWRCVKENEALPLFIVDAADMTIEEIRALCTRVRATRKIKAVMVDYLQLVKTKQRFDRYDLTIGYIAKELKAMGKEIGAPVTLLSQLSRKVDERPDHEPQMSDLKESGDIEAAADVIIFLWRPAIYDETQDPHDLRCKTAKNRHGGIGMWRLVFVVERSLVLNP